MPPSGGSDGGSAEVDFNVTLLSSYLKTIFRLASPSLRLLVLEVLIMRLLRCTSISVLLRRWKNEV